jgi:aldehyde:ferredoxin oxidoreductase
MRKAGLRALVVRGIAESPQYLQINDQKVEFKDARPLWGMNTGEAQAVMLEGQPKGAVTMAVGPAGEKLVRYAAIMTDGELYRAFGRGGGGCVMGSKNLKGIVLSGSGEVEIPDMEQFNKVKQTITANIKAKDAWAKPWRRWGTRGNVGRNNTLGYLPTRNWQGGTFDGIEGIDFTAHEAEYPWNNRPCGLYCPTPCGDSIDIKQGPYQGTQCDAPEYETIYTFGSDCGVARLDAVCVAGKICDEGGLDSMSAGVVVGFAMECYERGLLTREDLDGIDLRFGNHEAMIAVLKKIVTREGCGHRLGEGVRRMAQGIPGSEGFAIHAKGMELGGYECRGLNGQALQFAINAAGGTHHGYGLPAIAEAANGTRLNTEGKGETVKNAAIKRIFSDCLVICTFPGLVVDEVILASLTSAMRAEPYSVDDLKEAGVRIMAQERLFNMRELNLTREGDTLPERLLKEPKPDGPTQGATIPLEILKDDYYRVMGWDVATGNPPDTLLAKLGIEK